MKCLIRDVIIDETDKPKQGKTMREFRTIAKGNGVRLAAFFALDGMRRRPNKS